MAESENGNSPLSPAAIPEVVQSLIDRPRETLAVELKGWINPREIDGQAKIAKACLALRNQNGGYLVCAVDDKTLAPLSSSAPASVRELFHADVIQRIVSAYSSILFPIEVYFPARDGIEFPVVQIPGGLTTPVACKADRQASGRFFLRESEIYVRTLVSNGTVSTARASWRDLESLVNRCHDNREADFARVFARMVQGMSKASFAKVLSSFAEFAVAASASASTPDKVLEEGESEFAKVIADREIDLPPLGFWDTGLVIQGDIPPHRPNRDFLRLLASANPDLTGWPVWLDSTQFSDESARPYIAHDRWETLIFRGRTEEEREWGSLDFWTLDPKGMFFLRRAHQDDLGGSGRGTALVLLDPHLVILRTCEAFAVGQAFGRALGCDEPTTTLSFAFKWTGLRGRRLEAWTSPMQPMSGFGVSQQDVARSRVTLPLSANEEAIALATQEAVAPLMSVFGGYEPRYEVIRQWTSKLLQRKL